MKLPRGYVLEEATPDDIDDLLALELRCYPAQSAYTRNEYQYALVRAKAVNLVLRPGNGKAPTGFAGGFIHQGWKAGHVYTVNVDPSERGKGFGRLLMDALEEGMRKAGMTRSVLEVNVENTPAIGLYEGMGYTRVKRLKNYYSTYPNPDAYLYEKPL
ncbi:MAG TPA: N-acetyltransferase [Candidatus Thermoplasmatota archaeon]|nr:N-acetyltransferase [Candidatus Thermoplasmatota archaeon]